MTMIGRICRGAVAAAVMLWLATPAAAQMATANAQQIAKLMQAQGLQAQITTTDSGGTEIKSSASGANFYVSLLNCDEGTGKNCKTVQFYVGWSTTEKRSLAKINEWNRSKRFAKAYLDDDKDPWLDMDVNLDFGGVTEKNLNDCIELWVSLMGQFQDELDL
jgi:hypothetical protein